jgi:MscS family membrane protein
MLKQTFKIALIVLTSFHFLSLNGQADSTLATPYDAIYNHLYYLQHDSYQPAQSALSFDLALAPEKAQKLAIKLKQILDGKGLYVQMSKVPEEANYVDSTYQKKQYYLFPEALPEVYVEFRNKRWQYGNETVKAIPTLHRQTYPMGTDYLLKVLERDSGKTYWGLFTWQYIGILSMIFLAFILFLLLRLLFKPILRKIGKMSFHIDLDNEKLLNSTTHILSLLTVFFLLKLVFPVLQMPVKWTSFTKRALEIIITVFIALLLLRVLEYVMNYFKSIADRTESKMDDQLIPILRQIIKLVIIGAAIFQILHLINVNVAALIAGISIGGLALALAAKDTVNNLIGSMMIFLDKPFQIGDFIEVNGQFGTVIEVGFRTTRIQTKDTSILFHSKWNHSQYYFDQHGYQGIPTF